MYIKDVRDEGSAVIAIPCRVDVSFFFPLSCLLDFFPNDWKKEGAIS
jgi:hypothetical protein